MARRWKFGAGMAAALLSACASPRRDLVVPLQARVIEPAPQEAAFPGSASILDGFDLATSPEDWQIGDRVLVGVRVTNPRRGDGETVRMLLIELTDRHNVTPLISFRASPAGREPYSVTAGAYFTRLTIYDAEGRELSRGVGRFPDRIMGHGLYDGAAPSVGRARDAAGNIDVSGLSDEAYERELLGWLSLFSFSTSLGKSTIFMPLVKDVLARPSWLRMLFNQDVELGMGEAHEVRLEAWAPGGSGVPVDAVSMPLTCAIAGKRAAAARVQAARPVAPLGLTGGVVSVVGSNADKPDVRFEVRVLAAARGTGGRAFRPAMEAAEP
jgi:hypothetical protein